MKKILLTWMVVICFDSLALVIPINTDSIKHIKVPGFEYVHKDGKVIEVKIYMEKD